MKLITDVMVEPVTVAEVEAFLRKSTGVESTLHTMWIAAARTYGEDYTKHALAPQTWDMYLDAFPDDDYIAWPKAPLTSVTGIYYTDYEGTVTTMTVNTDYKVDTDTFPGKIYLPYNTEWPTATLQPYNGIRIRAVCGYTGTAPYILPKQYKQALLMHIGAMDRYRDEVIPEDIMTAIHRLYAIRRVPNL